MRDYSGVDAAPVPASDAGDTGRLRNAKGHRRGRRLRSDLAQQSIHWEYRDLGVILLQRAQTALDDLSLTYTVGSASSFNTLLNGSSWDLVVVDCPSTTPGDWTPLISYTDGGGSAIMSFWDLDNDLGLGHSELAGAFDVSVAGSLNSPQDVYRREASHAIFNSPNVLGDLTNWTDEWGDNGDRLDALDGAQARAGFAGTATAGQAAIVLGHDGATICNGFLFDDLASSAIIANEITYLLPPSVPAPGAVLLGVWGMGLAGWLHRRRSL